MCMPIDLHSEETMRCYRCHRKEATEHLTGVAACEDCGRALEQSGKDPRRCPIDGSSLKKQVLLGVVTDRCPSCAGVWLDSGEVDIVQKRAAESGGSDFTSGFFLGMGLR